MNFIFGGDGNDFIKTSATPATIHAGAGDDYVIASADDTVPVSVYLESGNDKVYMTNDGDAYGGPGDDYLWGNN